MGRVSEDARFARALNAPDAKPIVTTFARMGTVTLDDGSKVRLAPESQITVPKLFGPDLRVVRLQGIGEFTVAKGMEQPFRVNAGNVAIVATGTAFTVRVGDDQSGTVVVTDGTVRPATDAERDEADAWRAVTLVVNDKPLGQVLNLMKRWYGLTILVQQPALMERKVSFRASLDSTRPAIRGIEESAGVQFGYIGQNMAFHEAAKDSAPAAKRGKKK